MTLVPATGVVSVVAKAAKLDPVGTSELIRLALFETLCDFSEIDREVIENAVAKSMQDRAGMARRHLVRQYVGKRLAGEGVDELLEAAGQWGTVVKASPWDRNDRPAFDETKVHRDYRGRFARRLAGDNVFDSRRGAADTVRDLVRRGAARPGDKIELEGRNLQTAQDGSRMIGGQHPGLETYIPGNREEFERYLEGQEGSGLIPDYVRVTPTGGELTGQRRNLVDVAGAAMGSAASQRAAAYDPSEFKGGLQAWQNPDDENGRRAFRRVKIIGQHLQNQSTPQSALHTVGGVASLVGDLGPQAEAVLGNNIKHTAYRYRGTERRPDRAVISDVEAFATPQDQARVLASAQQALQEEQRTRSVKPPRAYRSERPFGSQWTPAEGIALFWDNKNNQRAHGIDDPETDQLDMRLRGDAASAYYINKLPDPKLAALTRASNRPAPPSQGVIIDHRGRVVTQAQGFAHDHYLPFDLKNLKSLQGGQYVRTRVGGGPTDEDVYTGLLTGARQVQVVSNSGVFTLEFDPDVRGGRRYSDKARNMIQRYGQILARINENANTEGDVLYQQDISDQEKAKIRREAYDSFGYDRKAFDDEVKRKTNEARMKQSLRPDEASEDEEKAVIRAQVLSEWENRSDVRTHHVAAEVEDRFKRAQQEREETRVKPYQLNGEGYFDALRALQQEFPYYLRAVDWQPLNDFRQDRGIGGPTPGSPNFKDPNYQSPGGPGRTSRATTPRVEEGRDEDRSGTGTPRGPSGGGGGQGAAGAMPRGLVPPPVQHDSGKLTDLNEQMDGFLAQAEPAMSNMQRAITGIAVGVSQLPEVPPDQLDLDRYAGGEPTEFLQALDAKARGARNIPKFIADPTKVTDDQAQAVPDAIRSYINLRPSLMESMANLLPSDEELEDYAQKIQLVVAARKPFADPAQNMALYDPGDNGLPQRYDDINKLGTNQENYANFMQVMDQRGQAAKPFVDAVAQLGSKDGNARRDFIKQAVANYKELARFGAKPDAKVDNVPSMLLPGQPRPVVLRLAKEVNRDPDNNEQLRELSQQQAAWAFVHARDLADAANPGGGGAPFAPPALEAGQPPVIPQFRTGFTTPADAAARRRAPTPHTEPPGEEGEVSHRAPDDTLTKRDVLLLHPPGQDQGWLLVKELLGVPDLQ